MLQGHREKTEGHIITLELQIYAIESANINRETLGAMEQASAAMKQIHGKLSPEKVDMIMCVLLKFSLSDLGCLCIITSNREKLRAQNDLSNEIVEAMNGMDIASENNQEELEAELEELQEKRLDEKAASVPSSSTAARMPTVPGHNGKSPSSLDRFHELVVTFSCSPFQKYDGGG